MTVTPTCARCNNHLQRLDMSRGLITLGTIPTLYSGVVCVKCGKVECSKCKGNNLQKPCSWCGGNVSPAYEHLLR